MEVLAAAGANQAQLLPGSITSLSHAHESYLMVHVMFAGYNLSMTVHCCKMVPHCAAAAAECVAVGQLAPCAGC